MESDREYRPDVISSGINLIRNVLNEGHKKVSKHMLGVGKVDQTHEDMINLFNIKRD